MKKLRKFVLNIFIILIISVLIFSLSGCYSAQSIDDLTYAIALGIDKGEHNNLAITVQFTFPNASEGGSSGETAPQL